MNTVREMIHSSYNFVSLYLTFKLNIQILNLVFSRSLSITFSRPEQGARTCEGEIELHPLKGAARCPKILEMDFFFMALVKLYMSKVVNVEEKPSYAESHVGLVKAGGCGEPKLQTPLTLPQFQGSARH